jgi:hypothetical protein
MRIFWVLLKKELRAFFVSPVAYIVLALVMVLSGFSFRAALSVLESAPSEGSIVTWTFHAMWFWLSYFNFYLIFYGVRCAYYCVQKSGRKFNYSCYCGCLVTQFNFVSGSHCTYLVSYE